MTPRPSPTVADAVRRLQAVIATGDTSSLRLDDLEVTVEAARRDLVTRYADAWPQGGAR